MKVYKICVLFIFCLFLTSCYNRIECDSSNNVKLGQTDYSNEFKEWENESKQDTIELSSSSHSLMLIKKKRQSSEPLRLLEYPVCKSIDIKPYTAYAYYEYKNLTSIFSADSMILAVEPQIAYENGERVELLYLSFDKARVGGLKGRIPVTNASAVKSEEPFGVLFKFYEQIEIGKQKHSNIWAYKKGDVAMYYSKTIGVVAIEAGGKVFTRKK